MATDNKLQRIDGVDADVERALTGIARDVGDAYHLMDRLESAAQDPTVALAAISGMKVDAAIYKFRVGSSGEVVGITHKGAKVLMSRRGDLDVLDAKVERTTVRVRNGEGEEEDVDAWSATVRVKDLRNNVTFLGQCTEPAVLIRKDGSRLIDDMADRKAVTKATRNAILDHFAGVEDYITQFVKERIAAGDAFVGGEPDAQAEEVSRQIAATATKRKAREQIPIGDSGAKRLVQRVADLESEAKLQPGALAGEFGKWRSARWPGLKTQEIPAREEPAIDEWFDTKRRALGLVLEVSVNPAPPADEDRGEAITPPMTDEEQSALGAQLFDD